ncbi:MAG: site-specific integrase [Brevundimonas sp.]|uniref:site-specific integrase n=1 Tax=Brevundimonas sp. TaxID=1871086 RepID=UPI002716C8E3|nr:site-specific integrase [Brevundimonas sp.]MDO9589246.1 site-specific integrase [Brevundimonas sp.]
MSLVTNVFRRGGSYYFRARVPERFRAVLERRELWRSLRTGEPSKARQRASLVAQLTHRLWRDLDYLMSTTQPISPGELKRLVDEWLRAELEEDAYLRTAPVGEVHVAAILKRQPRGVSDTIVGYLDHSELETFRAGDPNEQARSLGPNGYLLTEVSQLDLRRAARDKMFEDAGDRHATGDESIATSHLDGVLRRSGLEVSPFSDAYETATKQMVRAHQDVLTSIKLRDTAAWRPELDDDPAEVVLSRLPSPAQAPIIGEKKAGTTLRLSDAARQAISEMTRTEGFKRKRVDDYENAVATFTLWRGHDPLLADVAKEDAGAFKTALSHYPANPNKRAAYRDLPTFAARQAKAIELGEERLLGSVTINGKYLTPLRKIYGWHAGVGVGRADDNPFTGITMKKPRRVDQHEQRRDFTASELQRFFDLPLFTGSSGERGPPLYQPGICRVRDWRFWVPLICVFSGMRLNEACGLALADIKVQDEVTFFHVRDDFEDQSTKGNASRRKVPLHHTLISLGLLPWIASQRDAGAVRLFGDLKVDAQGYYSREPSKFLNRHVRRAVDDDPDDPGKLVFHSSRHTVTSRLRAAEVRKDVAEEIVGHEKGDTHSGYGTYDVATLKAAIDKVEYAGLDLSRLAIA